jgi:prepilin-type processing-associated H-X9-DG protein
LARAKARAQNAVCIDHLRQLGIATRVYAEDNAGRLPSAEILPTDPLDPQNPLPRICDVLASDIGQATANTNQAPVFKCPNDDLGLFASEGSSYEWNSELNGHRIDETKTSSLFLVWVTNNVPVQSTNFTLRFPPDTTPLMLDYEEFHPRWPQSGKNVVYMDGHVDPLNVAPD